MGRAVPRLAAGKQVDRFKGSNYNIGIATLHPK